MGRPSQGQIFERLSRELASRADGVLLAAIDHARADEVRGLVEVALEHPSKRLVLGLIRRSSRLHSRQMGRLAAYLEGHGNLLRDAAGARDAGLRAGCLSVLEHLDDPRDLDLLRSTLADERAGLRARSERLMVRWVRRVFADDESSALTATTAETVGELFRRLADGPSEALAWGLAVAGPTLGRRVEGVLEAAPRRHVASLERVLSEADDVLVADRLTWWTGVEALAERAARGLAGVPVRDQPQLVRYPETACLASVQRSVLGTTSVQKLTRQLGTAVVSGVAAERSRTAEERVAVLADLVGDGSVSVRSVALRQLTTLANETAEAARVIERYLGDASEDLARAAMAWLIGAGSGRDVLTRALRSPHASVRSMAAARVAPGVFEGLCASWPRLDAEQRRDAGQKLMRLDERLIERLDGLLRRPDRALRLRALAMVRELGLAAALEPRVAELASSSDERLASAAVTVLGVSRTETSALSIEQALGHADGRVRANAVEALPAPASETELRRLVTLTNERHNRVRANAIASLIDHARLDQALSRLRLMLEDAREAHRASAIWVAQSRVVEPVTPRLVEMAAGDPSVRVRERAQRAATEVIVRIEREAMNTSKLLASRKATLAKGAA
ncbi:MAG: HEAT repeat domain-containing protein [Phycisphaeraceae bacterium]